MFVEIQNAGTVPLILALFCVGPGILSDMDQVVSEERLEDELTDVDDDVEDVPISQSHVIQGISDTDLNAFWKEHDAWRAEVNSRCLRVDVGDPIQSPRTFMNPSPTVFYQVETRSLNASVLRRYSDFEWLREALHSQFPGAVLPSLPDKRIVGNHFSDFLKNRARGLQLFISGVVTDPYFASNTALLTFLTLSDQVKWDMYQKSLALGTEKGVSVDTDVSRSKWQQAVHNYKLPVSHSNVINSLRGELDIIEVLLRSVFDGVSKLRTASRQFVQSLGDIKSSFEETDLNSVSFPLRTAYQALGGTFTAWGISESQSPGILSNLLADAIQVELDHVKEFKKVFCQRDSLVNSVEQLKNTISKLSTELKTCQNAGNKTDKSNKIMIKILKAKKDLNSSQNELDIVTKAVFFMEIDLYSQTKASFVKNLQATFAHAQIEYLKSLTTVWEQSL